MNYLLVLTLTLLHILTFHPCLNVPLPKADLLEARNSSAISLRHFTNNHHVDDHEHISRLHEEGNDLEKPKRLHHKRAHKNLDPLKKSKTPLAIILATPDLNQLKPKNHYRRHSHKDHHSRKRSKYVDSDEYTSNLRNELLDDLEKDNKALEKTSKEDSLIKLTRKSKLSGINTKRYEGNVNNDELLELLRKIFKIKSDSNEDDELSSDVEQLEEQSGEAKEPSHKQQSDLLLHKSKLLDYNVSYSTHPSDKRISHQKITLKGHLSMPLSELSARLSSSKGHLSSEELAYARALSKKYSDALLSKHRSNKAVSTEISTRKSLEDLSEETLEDSESDTQLSKHLSEKHLNTNLDSIVSSEKLLDEATSADPLTKVSHASKAHLKSEDSVEKLSADKISYSVPKKSLKEAHRLKKHDEDESHDINKDVNKLLNKNLHQSSLQSLESVVSISSSSKEHKNFESHQWPDSSEELSQKNSHKKQDSNNLSHDLSNYSPEELDEKSSDLDSKLSSEEKNAHYSSIDVSTSLSNAGAISKSSNENISELSDENAQADHLIQVLEDSLKITLHNNQLKSSEKLVESTEKELDLSKLHSSAESSDLAAETHLLKESEINSLLSILSEEDQSKSVASKQSFASKDLSEERYDSSEWSTELKSSRDTSEVAPESVEKLLVQAQSLEPSESLHSESTETLQEHLRVPLEEVNKSPELFGSNPLDTTIEKLSYEISASEQQKSSESEPNLSSELRTSSEILKKSILLSPSTENDLSESRRNVSKLLEEWLDDESSEPNLLQLDKSLPTESNLNEQSTSLESSLELSKESFKNKLRNLPLDSSIDYSEADNVLTNENNEFSKDVQVVHLSDELNEPEDNNSNHLSSEISILSEEMLAEHPNDQIYYQYNSGDLIDVSKTSEDINDKVDSKISSELDKDTHTTGQLYTLHEEALHKPYQVVLSDIKPTESSLYHRKHIELIAEDPLNDSAYEVLSEPKVECTKLRGYSKCHKNSVGDSDSAEKLKQAANSEDCQNLANSYDDKERYNRIYKLSFVFNKK